MSGFLVVTLDEAAKLLEQAGVDVTAEDIASDVEAGLPQSEPGKIDLFQYLAWLMDG